MLFLTGNRGMGELYPFLMIIAAGQYVALCVRNGAIWEVSRHLKLKTDKRFGCWGVLVVCVAALMACAQTAPLKNTRQQLGKAIERADYQKAYRLIIDDAAAGDAGLQYTAATLIANGFGPPDLVNRDQLTLSWLLKSADQGYKDALLWLADAYKNGWFGLEKDTEAEHCWRALAIRFDPAQAAACRRPLLDDDSNTNDVTGP